MKTIQQNDIQKQIDSLKSDLAKLSDTFKKHTHDGSDSLQIKELNIVNSTKAVGSIRMATDGRIYKIGVPTGTRNVFFNGVALHTTSDVWSNTGPWNVRVLVVGSAQLRKGYNLQPDEIEKYLSNGEIKIRGKAGSEVVVGGLLQEITQSSTSQTVVGTAYTTNVSEYYLTQVLYPDGNTIPAQAEIVGYTDNYIEVEVNLDPGWGIIANFVFT